MADKINVPTILLILGKENEIFHGVAQKNDNQTNTELRSSNAHENSQKMH